MFRDLYSIMVHGETAVGKFSVRGYETDIAVAGFLENPIFGKGKISPKWFTGGFHTFHGYFYPTDVGLIGTLFLFGIIGTILIYSQFIFVAYYFLRIKHKNSIFLQICLYYLLILFIDSISNGYLYLYSAHTLTIVGIVYYYYIREQRASSLLPTRDPI